MIAIIDYGVGNLFSLRCSLGMIGADAVVTGNAEEIHSASSLILPGVGAFRDAANKLFESGLAQVIYKELEAGKPLMGICLGMQLLFDKSFENGEYTGLGLIPGSVVPLKDSVPKEMKIPQMGWNSLDIKRESPIFKNTKSGDDVYFVHSYYASGCEKDTIATTEYGGFDVTAAVAKNNVYGCQFHPEKSGKIGLDILRAFCEVTG